MAALHITKKQAKRLAEIQVAEELFTTYLAMWSRQEVQSMVSNGSLVVLRVKNGYRVGPHQVVEHKGRWQVTSDFNDHALDFSNKKAAIFYCLLEHKKLYTRSKDLFYSDGEVHRLELDQKLYRHKYKQACESKDTFGQDLCLARLSDVTPKLKAAQERLEKMINSAKYIKIWDTQP